MNITIIGRSEVLYNTANYIGHQVVVDVHTAGLKVAEGMLKANEKQFDKKEYKVFMQTPYSAISFEEEKCWQGKRSR